MWLTPAWRPQAIHEYRLLGLALLCLYLVNWSHLPTWFSQALLLAHLLSFMLWHSLHGEREALSWFNLILILVLSAAFVAFLNPWLLLLWKWLLLGVVAGQGFVRRVGSGVKFSALGFLAAGILCFDVPPLFGFSALADGPGLLLRYLLLLLPLSYLLLNAEEEAGERPPLEFFHGFSAAMLLAFLGMATLLVAQRLEQGYFLALGWTALGGMLLLLLLTWLWTVLSGLSDPKQLWARQPLNFSHDFEKWLSAMVQPGNYKHLTPEQFLETGLQQVANVPWLSGLHWLSPYGEGQFGEASHYRANVLVQALEVTIYARRPISGPNYAHVKLLVQLLEHFHQAKIREEEFAQQAHLQAIHETGAKLTHDIKNLLQSLYVITSAIDTATTPEKFGDTVRLWKGQLPHLTQRLKRTLDKLQQPSQSIYTNVPVRVWWDNLCARYRKREIEFSASIMWNANVPEDLFDNVVENLLENALNKRKREPSLRIHVALSTAENQVQLSICDDGSPIPADVEKNLLNQPVPSRDGFGIGLYQAAKQTIHTGYRLRISHNQAGQVCFELSSV